jgi:hypothetical protein
VSAHPAYASDPDDPIEILDVLPEEYHEQFLTEYAAAVDGARHPEHFHQLQEVLRLWRLRAGAYSSPGYAGRLAAALEEGAADAIPASRLIPGWSDEHQGQ